MFHSSLQALYETVFSPINMKAIQNDLNTFMPLSGFYSL